MTAAELEAHTIAFQAAYDRVNPGAPEDFKVWWAERVANSAVLQAIYSPTGPALAGRFEPADYTEDGKKRHGLGVPW